MKVLTVLGAFCLAGVVQAADYDVLKQEWMEIKRKCAIQVQASEDDLKRIEEAYDVTSDIAKKMMHCTLRSYHIISEDNKFSKEGIMAFARRHLDEGHPEAEGKLRIAEIKADACESEIRSNGATSVGPDLAKLLFDCLTQKFVDIDPTRGDHNTMMEYLTSRTHPIFPKDGSDSMQGSRAAPAL